MKFSVMKKIWDWLDEGYTTKEIAETYFIYPDIIDSINELRKVKVDLEVYA